MRESTPPSVARLIVSVESLERAVAIYSGALGLSVDRAAEGFAWLSTSDGTEILLHERPSHSNDGAVSIGFFVDDLDTTLELWVRGGGTIVDPPAVQPWGERMSVVTDVDGHVVCLSERA